MTFVARWVRCLFGSQWHPLNDECQDVIYRDEE